MVIGSDPGDLYRISSLLCCLLVGVSSEALEFLIELSHEGEMKWVMWRVASTGS